AAANGKSAVNGEKQKTNGMCDVPRKSLNTYSWQEIKAHNQEADQWLVVDRKVYNVTAWAARHPGGRKVLNHCAGEDATDAFRAMHLDLDVTRLYLKPLLIGELAPEDPSQERNKNVSEFSGLMSVWRDGPRIFRSQLVEDFQELRRSCEVMNLFNANLGFFSLHLLQILILETLAWLVLWHFGKTWSTTLVIYILLTISQQLHLSQAQSSFLQHDTGHICIFKKSKWNHLMQKFVMCHLKGLSSDWWNHRHFQHHVKPNIYPKDPDIDVGPLFLVGDLQPVRYGKKKIKYIDYEKQHLWTPPPHACIFQPTIHATYVPPKALGSKLPDSFSNDIAWVSSFYIRHFITFGPFYGIFGTIVLIFLVKVLESPWITYITQMSHIPMKMSEDENRDWFSTQVLGTCNVEQSFFNDWVSGHLNFQIEHHLFPTMPRHNYHWVAPLVGRCVPSMDCST
ncbi:Fatty acid desaturase 2-like protein FADS2P1, partial [Galemys pyrenaicus]